MYIHIYIYIYILYIYIYIYIYTYMYVCMYVVFEIVGFTSQFVTQNCLCCFSKLNLASKIYS